MRVLCEGVAVPESTSHTLQGLEGRPRVATEPKRRGLEAPRCLHASADVTFYFREFFSIINGATLNLSQTKPQLRVGPSTCPSYSIPKMERSGLHMNLSVAIIYMFYI